ncbi:MAG: glutathione S-transferase family protein [Alphaproteobacteria bacterium]|nr:glutathione S-transferase family protein [Rickettsiales bacterium]
MHTLYHYPLCPLSRKVRVLLSDMCIDYKIVIQKFWVKDKKFQQLNPMLTVPFLVTSDENCLFGSQTIVEYFDEFREIGKRFISGDIANRAKIRKAMFCFDEKCYHEATKYILRERVYKFFESNSPPDLLILNDAKVSLNYCLKYLSFLLQKNDYITGAELTMADLSIAAHISSLDYLGEIPWHFYPVVKNWYSTLKSRPSFAGILSDSIPGFLPVKHYKVLDF